MADSFVKVTLRDGSTHTVAAEGDPADLVGQAAAGHWAAEAGWLEVEGGGAVTRRLVAADQIVKIELFER
jgi:hypothetical protein